MASDDHDPARERLVVVVLESAPSPGGAVDAARGIMSKGTRPFRRGGGGRRRDTNEPAIRDGLHAVGARSWQINGSQLPDLLVLFRGRWFVFGVKTETGDLQPGEAEAPWPLVRTVEQALTAIGVITGSHAT